MDPSTGLRGCSRGAAMQSQLLCRLNEDIVCHTCACVGELVLYGTAKPNHSDADCFNSSAGVIKAA